MNTLTSRLCDLLSHEGATLIGVADLKSIQKNLSENLSLAISLAVSLKPEIILDLKDGPNQEYIQEYTRVNERLIHLSECASEFLQNQGYVSHSFEPTVPIVQEDILTADFSHKTAATRAGIGWIGKCALLITKDYGSAIRLTTILTNAPLTPGQPIITSQCGDCTICQNYCPIQAPSGKNWNPELFRDEFWNGIACYHYCNHVKNTRNLSSQVCGLCIAFCPYTRKYVQKSLDCPKLS